MTKTEDRGFFIYGRKSKQVIPVTWRLTAGETLSYTKPWRAEVTGKPTSSQREVDMDILDAHDRDFEFKLKTEDGSIFPCGIYDIDHLTDAYPTILYFEICSPEQKMGKFLTVYPAQV